MKKRMTRMFATVLSLAMVMTLAACGAKEETPAASAPAKSEAAKPAESIELILNSTLSTSEYDKQNTGTAVMLKNLVENIEKETNGEITVKLFLDGQLASGTADLVNAIQGGAVDIVNLASGNLAEYTNAAAGISVPFLFPTRDIANEVLAGEFGEEINQQIIEDVGVVPLAWLDQGFRITTNQKRPIVTPDDIKGLKIRTMSDKLQIAAWEELGASCATIAYAELFTALQQHVVDGQENPVSNIYSKRFYEVQKYCSTTNHSFAATLFCLNLDRWNSFTEEQQSAVMKAAADAADEAREVDIVATQELMDEMAAAGMEITYLTEEQIAAFREVALPVYDQAKELVGAERWERLQAAVAAAESAV